VVFNHLQKPLIEVYMNKENLQNQEQQKLENTTKKQWIEPKMEEMEILGGLGISTESSNSRSS
jgi:hypothetical protein